MQGNLGMQSRQLLPSSKHNAHTTQMDMHIKFWRFPDLRNGLGGDFHAATCRGTTWLTLTHLQNSVAAYIRMAEYAEDRKLGDTRHKS